MKPKMLRMLRMLGMLEEGRVGGINTPALPNKSESRKMNDISGDDKRRANGGASHFESVTRDLTAKNELTGASKSFFYFIYLLSLSLLSLSLLLLSLLLLSLYSGDVEFIPSRGPVRGRGGKAMGQPAPSIGGAANYVAPVPPAPPV